jgi:type II restriction/modification system DNA methylase subunit YeeA
MFGRYSLDSEGLAYAGGVFDAAKYRTFPADKDNIIQICDDEYFDDDITGRFVEFVKVVYGADTLEENLKYIADALGGKGTPREVIRNYFLNGFYSDHLKIYQKRPIYWLFDSGKKNGFKALIYMHRYSRDLLAKLRTDYVHEQQERYRTQLSHISTALNTATGAERARLLKQQDKLAEQAKEIGAFEEKVHHLADRNIEIDLDDGVKKNYEVFADVLSKI